METYKMLDEYGNVIGEANPWTDEMSKREEQHVQALEQLCRDLYAIPRSGYATNDKIEEDLFNRMSDLGLLDGEK